MKREWIHKIFNAKTNISDEEIISVFRFQYDSNSLYKVFADAVGANPSNIKSIRSIPFLPVQFFKSHEVVTTSFTPEACFESSGTTGSVNSRHLVRDLDIYKNDFTAGFRRFYGEPSDWCIIGLLPSYLERSNSSLVVMVNELIKLSGNAASGFYLDDYHGLIDTLDALKKTGQKTWLIGVSFALMDFAAQYPVHMENTVVIETGGMKGRRAEITRNELHQFLCSQWGLTSVHSEYGMTELLSQAYSSGNGLFFCPPWMRVLLREEDDPLQIMDRSSARPQKPVSGLINVIDLANIYSCSFIATDDVGRIHADGSFEVMGRRDNSDLRGCSLMVL